VKQWYRPRSNELILNILPTPCDSKAGKISTPLWRKVYLYPCDLPPKFARLNLTKLGSSPELGQSGRRLGRLPSRLRLRLFHSLLSSVLPQIRSGSCSRDYCAAELRCTPFSSQRFYSCVEEVAEPVGPQALFAQLAVEALNVTVLHRPAGAVCGAARSSTPDPRPGSDGWSAPGRCRNESPAAGRASQSAHRALL